MLVELLCGALGKCFMHMWQRLWEMMPKMSIALRCGRTARSQATG